MSTDPYPTIPESARASAHFVAGPTPHLILPEPFSAYCLTQYFPGTRDYDQVKRLACLPTTVPYFGPKGPDDPKGEPIMRWTDKWWTGAGRFWPLQMVRRTAEVQTLDPSSPPDIVGCIGFEREHFANVPITNEEREKRVASELEKPHSEGMWELNMLVIDPEHGKKGLMSVVFKLIMDIWLLPLVGDRRGFLGSAWETANGPSDKWHKRNGFEPVGQQAQGKSVYVAAIWQGFEGERAIDKADTIYKDLPDSV